MKINLNDFASVSIENLEILLNEQNYPQYLGYLSDLSNNGDLEAIKKLFDIYFWGSEFTESDQPKALELLRIFAEKYKSAECARMLSERYRYYTDDDEHEQKFIYWLNYGESLLDGESAYELGKAYYFGRHGLNEDEDLGVEHLERSLNYGHEGTYLILSKIYLRSNSETKQTRGRELLVTGAKSANSECQYELAIRNLNGVGFNKDSKAGVSWLMKSADQGNSEALLKLGELYLEGDLIEKNAYDGFCCIEKSARSHSKVSQARLSALYLLGVGVEKNLTFAYAWLRIADLNFHRNERTTASFIWELLGSNVLSDAERSHADKFVADFTNDETWRYRVSDE